MTSPRTWIGPLTTTWTPPPVCSYAMALSTGTTGWQAQTCSSGIDAHDWTDCWPPAASTWSLNPGVLMGYGYYSPGIICPAGYTTAAHATAGGSTDSGWGIEYSLTSGETAVACCPTGFSPSWIEASSTYAQTCVVTATATTVSTVQCANGAFADFSVLSVPNQSQKSFLLFAPLIQLNFQASDVPSSTSATSTTNPASTTTPAAPVSFSISTVYESNSAGNVTSSVISVPVTGSPATETNTPGAGDTNSQGLSTGAKAGIGAGVGAGVLALLVAGLFGLMAYRRKRIAGRGARMEEKDDKPMPELDGPELHELAGPEPQEVGAAAVSLGRPRQPVAIFELEASTPDRLSTSDQRAGHMAPSVSERSQGSYPDSPLPVSAFPDSPNNTRVSRESRD